MAKDRREGILLESGTNEVEIIEFYVRGQSFGVNVAKVRQLIVFEEGALSAMPNCPRAYRGVYLHRDQTMPLIDLGDALNLQAPENGKEPSLLLICSFNMSTIAFAIDGVNRIHRLSWSSFTPLNPFLSESCDSIIGSVNIDNREILITDLEQIIAEYDPKVKAMYTPEDASPETGISMSTYEQQVFMAEDSSLIRSVIDREMKRSGFVNVHIFSNGQEALNAITQLVDNCRKENKPLAGVVDVVVSDIEMPLLDGLSLCKRIKQELHLEIPVMIYSSLIDDEMARKCVSVGADAYFSKPNIGALIEAVRKKVDELFPKKK
ncbi:chemotaxis protein CheV [Planctomycetales bacterium]|nr:chemotaxis protein CheV [Planctomycetales bacterium]GHT02935.1 chemotaxis protein CheV [Planctomycetales bacterium]GHV21696.1 chemotaxis protein CheV [Planctomycetales bacterium]